MITDTASRRAVLRTVGTALAIPQLSAPSLAATGATGASQANPATTPSSASGTGPQGAPMKMHTRPIPSSGEPLPVVGCGTYVGFDVEPGTAAYRELPKVLQALFVSGGTVIDSSPMYGRAETTLGELLERSPARERAFVATKVWISSRERGIEQMTQSMARLKTKPIDLMQIHNLVDWRAHLATLQEWKQKGLVRYIGVTHYTASAYKQLEDVMREHALDFVQLNYSIDEREAEARLLPLAADLGIAVIVNRPFGGGGLLGRLRKRPLPDWAAEIGVTSWAQALLKFVLGHPAVTCVIPGTGKPAHMSDNAAAGTGELPDLAMRERMAAQWR
jgi:diketogulonate reductase-like aldo/keto reductase